LIKKDGLLAGKHMVDNSKHAKPNDKDVEAFCAGVQRICFEDESANFLEKVGEYIADICYLACTHQVKLEPKFINASLAVEIMEGIASSLDSSLTVQGIALPLVLKAEAMHGLRRTNIREKINSLFGWK
tara:strand:- start:591 stop:977 length:387 start_codon:yes stop_codon:yes gene_type:complete